MNDAPKIKVEQQAVEYHATIVRDTNTRLFFNSTGFFILRILSSYTEWVWQDEPKRNRDWPKHHNLSGTLMILSSLGIISVYWILRVKWLFWERQLFDPCKVEFFSIHGVSQFKIIAVNAVFTDAIIRVKWESQQHGECISHAED